MRNRMEQGPALCGFGPVAGSLKVVMDPAHKDEMVRPLAFRGTAGQKPVLSARLPVRISESQPVSLPSHRIRNAPRRRFLYGWGARLIIRQSLRDSVRRLRYLDTFAPMELCQPVQPPQQVPKLFLRCPAGKGVLQMPKPMGEESLTGIAPAAAIHGEREPMQVVTPAVVHGLLPVGPVWARPEQTTVSLKRNARGCDGVFLPQVAVAPLQIGFALASSPPEALSGNGERRGVVIPFSELAAAASASGASGGASSVLRRRSS